MRFKGFFIVIIDMLLVLGAFLVATLLKPDDILYLLPFYTVYLFYFLLIWVLVSSWAGKYNQHIKHKAYEYWVPMISINVTILLLVLMLIYVVKVPIQSRLIVFGTFFFSTLFEIILALLFFRWIKKTGQIQASKLTIAESNRMPMPQLTYDIAQSFPVISVCESCKESLHKKYFKEQPALYHFIDETILLSSISRYKTLVLNTKTFFNVQYLDDDASQLFINLHKINDIIRINRYFIRVNEILVGGGFFVGCVETLDLRKQRLFKKFPFVINILYYVGDYLFKRVFPKLPISKQIYFFVTRGKKRVISKAEVLGRLYSCGFEIVEEAEIDGVLYFVARKINHPYLDQKPTYGPFISLERIGHNGKIIKVYKLRTMFPYSEFIQDYMYKKHKLQEGGKFKNDFRISTMGRIMRRLWIDELPMLLNLLKGEMKLVGVRPLSRHYFSLYPKEVQERRIHYKPGLIPPFYADMPKSFQEIVASEEKYFNAYDRNPYLTDIRYMLAAFKNIVFKKARSN